MSEEGSAGNAAAAASTPKAKVAKKPKTARMHPEVSEMVNDAIQSLKERGGSSLQAIKKHVDAHHKVDMDRFTPFLLKYLKSAVAAGTLIQTKGKGTSGSFKLSASGQKVKEPVKAKENKKKGCSSANKPAAQPKSPKKAPKVSGKGEDVKKVGKAQEPDDRKRRLSFLLYVYRVLKEEHPNLGVSRILSIMSSFVNDIARISAESSNLAQCSQVQEIRTAVRLLLSGKLAKHAVSERKQRHH